MDSLNYVRRNFLLNLIDGALFIFALSLVSLSTVVPVLIKKCGGGNIAIGLIPVMWMLGFNFPQILIAGRVGRRPFVKGLVLKTALIQRIPWLILAGIIYFFIDDMHNEIAVMIILLGIFIAAVGGSLNLPSWFDLIAKITPVEIRGRLFAYRSTFGALLGIGGGAIVAYILDSFVYPENFALLFALAFFIMMVSYFCVVGLREEKPQAQITKYSIRDYFHKMSEIIKTDHNFRRFLIADALMIGALMADAFYTVNALEKFSLSDGYAGKFTMIMMGTMILSNLIFGKLADRVGHKINLFMAATSTCFICLTALMAPRFEIYMFVFAGMALTLSLIQISRLSIIAELSAEKDRAIYVALTNVITSPSTLMGIFAGLLANSYGYNSVFMFAGVFAFSSALWYWKGVEEPREILMRMTPNRTNI